MQARILDQQEVIDVLVFEISQKVFSRCPEITEQYGEKGRKQTMADLHKHFHYLQTAFRLQAPELFIDHVKWVFNVLTSRNIRIDFVLTGLYIMKESLNGRFAPEKEQFYGNCLDEAVSWLEKNLPA